MNVLFESDTITDGFLGARAICPKCKADVVARRGLCGVELQQMMNQQQRGSEFLMYCPRCGEKLTLGAIIDATDAKVEIVEEEKDAKNGNNGTSTETTAKS